MEAQDNAEVPAVQDEAAEGEVAVVEDMGQESERILVVDDSQGGPPQDDWDADTSFDLALSQVPADQLDAILSQQPLSQSALPNEPALLPVPAPVTTIPISMKKIVTKPKAAPPPIRKPLAPSLTANRPTAPPNSQGGYSASARLSQTLKQPFKKPTFVRKPVPQQSKTSGPLPPAIPEKKEKVIVDLTEGIDFGSMEDGDLSF